MAGRAAAVPARERELEIALGLIEGQAAARTRSPRVPVVRRPSGCGCSPRQSASTSWGSSAAGSEFWRMRHNSGERVGASWGSTNRSRALPSMTASDDDGH